MGGDRAPLLRRGLLARGVGGFLQVVSFLTFMAACDHARAAISWMLGGDGEPAWSATVGALLGADAELLKAQPGGYLVASLVVVGVAYGVGIVGLRVHRRGRQFGAAAVPVTTAPTGGPFVMYLRPFDADLNFASLGQLPPPIGSLWTFEEQLRDAVATIGELRAINEPGQAVPATGAVRRDVEDWRSDVRRSMAHARLVIIVLGLSPGVRWEVEEALRHVLPHRLLLLTPAGRTGHDRVCAALGGLFPYGLPSYPPGRPLAYLPVGCAILFDAAGRPHAIRLDRVLVPLSRPFRSAFVRQLRPVYAAVDAPWPGRRGVRFPRPRSRARDRTRGEPRVGRRA
jgi:hypothetical protein